MKKHVFESVKILDFTRLLPGDVKALLPYLESTDPGRGALFGGVQGGLRCAAIRDQFEKAPEATLKKYGIPAHAPTLKTLCYAHEYRPLSG